MTIAKLSSITLNEFLQLPETKPYCEYINGQIIAKPMPKGRHSRLQSKLCAVINQISETEKIAYAFPELRCSFGDRSIVPDLAICKWDQIPFTKEGEVSDNFILPPDWTIEILSPDQKPNKVIGNILYCLDYGCQLGWFIDPDDLSILSFIPNQQPKLLYSNDNLPILEGIKLQLTVDDVFSWLKMNV